MKVAVMITSMKILSFLGVGIILVYGANCDSTSHKKLADSINHFTLNLYKELLKTEKDNLFCSGFSLSSVLNMLLAGARGDTSTEINSTLGYDQYGLSEQQVKDSFRQLLTNQRGSNHSEYELDFANSVWFQNGFNVLPEFKSNINENFLVEEKQLDFATDPLSKNQINAWVSNKTHGRIPSLFDSPLSPATVMVLANTVYFKGAWLKPFSKGLTEDVDFISSGNTKAVPMMQIYKVYHYSNDTNLKAQILELPYNGEDVSMILILPTNSTGLETLENQLTLDSLNQAINGTTSESRVHVFVPKFNISSKIPLNDILQNLGIVKAFSQSEADFSGISGSTNLHVSDSIQKANIEVNEEGTVAAAGSAIAFPLSSNFEPLVFKADHPFLFLIRQKSTGIILFMGRVAKL